jgi:hypothetical protein
MEEQALSHPLRRLFPTTAVVVLLIAGAAKAAPQDNQAPDHICITNACMPHTPPADPSAIKKAVAAGDVRAVLAAHGAASDLVAAFMVNNQKQYDQGSFPMPPPTVIPGSESSSVDADGTMTIQFQAVKPDGSVTPARIRINTGG